MPRIFPGHASGPRHDSTSKILSGGRGFSDVANTGFVATSRDEFIRSGYPVETGWRRAGVGQAWGFCAQVTQKILKRACGWLTDSSKRKPRDPFSFGGIRQPSANFGDSVACLTLRIAHGTFRMDNSCGGSVGSTHLLLGGFGSLSGFGDVSGHQAWGFCAQVAQKIVNGLADG